MRALFIEPDILSAPGLLGEVLSRRGYEIVELCVAPSSGIADAAVEFPAVTGFDLIVAMGAPWSVYDRHIADWVSAETKLLTEADAAGVPVLGVCFGGQLLAAAHGGTVSAAPEPELGWTSVAAGDGGVIGPGPWFQWHSDRWTLPPGATELAATTAASQAFLLRRNLAVQFHPELTADILATWLGRSGDSVCCDRDELLRQTASQAPAAVRRAEDLVANFLDEVAVSR
jgi:GMP synthase-like glutamine amidotransferase